MECYHPKYLWIPHQRKNEFSNFNAVYQLEDYLLLETDYITDYEINGELGLLLSTSGSTGSPKMVRQSSENIIANIKSIVEYLKLDEKERPVTTLPMNYTYGLSIINSHLYAGAQIVLTERSLFQREFWDLVNEKEVTSFGGVPYHYTILDTINFYSFNIPSIRTMTQAGGKLNLSLHKKMAEYAAKNNKQFIIMYGQSEATARMSYLPAGKSLEKCGSIGIPIPGGKFSLIDDSGEAIDIPGQTGELVYEGENVTMGYADSCYDLYKGDERNKVLKTGDLANRDKDGYYYIVGRKKRDLKVFGNRVNLDELEGIIRNKYSDAKVCVYGTEDNIYVFTVDETKLKGIDYYLADITGINRTAFHVKEIKEIPMNESGKVLYKNLNKYIAI